MKNTEKKNEVVSKKSKKIDKKLKSFAQFLYDKEYLVRRSVNEAIDEYEKRNFDKP